MRNNQFEGMTALVVDDERMMRVLMGGLLHDIGIAKIYEAEDGAEALKLLETSYDINIIICDLEMPIISGLEFVSMLRMSKSVSDPNIPVLIVTGHSEQKNVHEAVRLGIHGFMVKPVSRKVLEDRMIHALKHPAIDPANLTKKKQVTKAVEVWDFNKPKG